MEEPAGPTGDQWQWDVNSRYYSVPPYFQNMPMRAAPVNPATLLRLQTEDLEPPVLPEVAVEGERHPSASGLENGEGDDVAQTPVLVRMRREDGLCALLLLGQRRGARAGHP